MSDRPMTHPNLLAWPGVRTLLKAPWFPVFFQALALLGMVALAMNGWGLGLNLPAKDLLTLRKTNFTTLAVWGLWWPGMIALALLAGRLWCTVCPMELISRVGHALGRRAALPQVRLWSLLRAGWLVLAGYALLQLLVAGLSIHRVPHFTALMLATLGGLALGAGLLFREERAFCKSICPAAALLSVYGRFTRLQLDKVSASTCESCTTKDCVDPKNRDRMDPRSCPSLIRPFDRQASDGCVLCFQCAKVCPAGNIGFGAQAGGQASARPLLKPFEAAFVMMAAGFVAHEVIGEVKWLDAQFHRVPALLNALSPRIGFGWFEALWFLVIFPALFWGVMVVLARVTGSRGPLGTLLLTLTTGAAPAVALAHLAKALAKVGNWGGFMPLAMEDPKGLITLQGLATHQIPSPTPLWGLPVLGWILLGGMTWLAWRALGEIRRHSEATQVPGLRLGFLGASVLFCGVLMTWLRA